MRLLLVWVLLSMLGGCVATPVVTLPSSQLRGEVRLVGPLPRPARVEVVVLSMMDGRPLPVAATEYEVTVLPLMFDLRLAPLQLAEGQIYVRTRLRFIGNSAVQAAHQQEVFKAFNGELVVINLKPRSCYPQCR